MKAWIILIISGIVMGEPAAPRVATRLRRRRCRRAGCIWPPTRACCLLWCACGWLTAVMLMLITVAIGLAVEEDAVRRAPGTLAFYAVDEVCAEPPTSPRGGRVRAWVTFDNASEAHAAVGHSVRHCGPCGGCSTPQDLQVYNETAQTLTKTATRCALRAFAGGGGAVARCYDELVGFSSTCTPCWVENVLCDQRRCLFTCLWGLLRGEPNNRDADQLSPCLQCDEKLCGPAFITCAGANRRRAGVTTDIGRRDAQELCGVV